MREDTVDEYLDGATDMNELAYRTGQVVFANAAIARTSAFGHDRIVGALVRATQLREELGDDLAELVLLGGTVASLLADGADINTKDLRFE